MNMEANFGVQSDGGNNNPPSFNPEELQNEEKLTVAEITEKLVDSNDEYLKELGKLEKGESFDEIWLATYHGSLCNWRYDISSLPGVPTFVNQEVIDEIDKRLYLIAEGLEAHDEGYKENTIH